MLTTDEIAHMLRNHVSALMAETNVELIRKKFRVGLYSVLNIMYEDGDIKSFRIEIKETDRFLLYAMVEVDNVHYLIEYDGIYCSTDIVSK